jgi:lipopolysaccharide transport system ATP-binding protein
MTELAVRVQNLGKQYRIGALQPRYRTLRDTLASAARKPFRAAKKLGLGNGEHREEKKTFWALKDVSFELGCGEVLGVIGRNGAGKSTLFKLLSRITDPSEGSAEIHGRVGSLLEVGTGFHPELTGRENIYLNGAILGMRRAEIENQFDEIVAFAEVERFIDTPVKHYSSGMYLRLAFAVAAHLETEILIVDEVLAVGDAEFQKKCLGRMSQVSRSGRTILFVSHNMAAISRLCSRTLVLERGHCVFDGNVQSAIDRYLASSSAAGWRFDLASCTTRTGSQRGRLTEILFVDEEGNAAPTASMGDGFNVLLRFTCSERISGLVFGIVVSDSMGNRVFRVQTDEACGSELPPWEGEGEIRCHIAELPLVAGVYQVSLGMSSRGENLDHITDVASFNVAEADVFGSGKAPTRFGGPVFVRSDWRMNSIGVRDQGSGVSIGNS